LDVAAGVCAEDVEANARATTRTDAMMEWREEIMSRKSARAGGVRSAARLSRDGTPR